MGKKSERNASTSLREACAEISASHINSAVIRRINSSFNSASTGYAEQAIVAKTFGRIQTAFWYKTEEEKEKFYDIINPFIDDVEHLDPRLAIAIIDLICNFLYMIPKMWQPFDGKFMPSRELIDTQKQFVEKFNISDNFYCNIHKGSLAYLERDHKNAYKLLDTARNHAPTPKSMPSYYKAIANIAKPIYEYDFERCTDIKNMNDYFPFSQYTKMIIEPLAHIKLLYLYSADRRYFLAFAKHVLMSIEEHSRDVGVHFHLVDPCEACHLLVSEIRQQFCLPISISAEFRPNVADKRAYYTVCRFFIMRWLAFNVSSTIYMSDIDMGAVAPLETLNSKILQADIGVMHGKLPLYRLPWANIRAGAMSIKPSRKSRLFLNIVFDAFVREFNKSSMMNWGIDQNVLYISYEYFNSLPHGLSIISLKYLQFGLIREFKEKAYLLLLVDSSYPDTFQESSIQQIET